MKPVKISVCIATYNGDKYIKEQLQSILAQLGPNDEVIVSDDQSSDNTIAVISSFNDPRIKIYSHKKIANPYHGAYTNIYYVYRNVENALLHATGDRIFLADQDDIWLPGKVARMMQEFDNGNECILHDNTVINNQHQVLLDSYFNRTRPGHSWFRFIIKCPYQGASMAFTRRIKDLCLPFPTNNPLSHDHWIACIAWTHGKNISFVKESLMLYRRHGHNVSPSSEKSPNPLSFKLSYRINLLRACLIAKKRQ